MMGSDGSGSASKEETMLGGSEEKKYDLYVDSKLSEVELQLIRRRVQEFIDAGALVQPDELKYLVRKIDHVLWVHERLRNGLST